MAKVYKECRSVSSPFVIADHLLNSAAVKLDDEQRYDPASTTKYLTKLAPGEDFSCDVMLESMSDFELPDMESLRLSFWTYFTSGTARRNRLHKTCHLTEISERKILKVRIPGKEFLGQEFGLRLAVIRLGKKSAPPLIIGDKVFNFKIERPELFPHRFESFRESGFPAGGLWRLNIQADSPEEDFLTDGRSNIELILNKDIENFVILIKDAARLNPETRQAHCMLVSSIASAAFRELCDWVLYYEKGMDRVEMDAGLAESSIGYAVLTALMNHLRFDSFEEVISFWQNDEEGQFNVILQEVMKLKKLFR